MTVYCDMPPEFYTWSEPIARKQHRCCECSAPILKGEKHFRYSGKWEGDFSTDRQHLACMEACMWIRDKFADGGECVPFGGLKEEFEEMRFNRPRRDKSGEQWKRLRQMMAVIFWRERRAMAVQYVKETR